MEKISEVGTLLGWSNQEACSSDLVGKTSVV